MKLAILSILLVAVASASCQDIDIWAFLEGNVIDPLLADIQTGATNLLTNLVNQLLAQSLASLFGKRDLLGLVSQYQNLIDSVVGSLNGQLSTLFSGLTSSLSEIFGSLGNFIGAKRMSTQRTVEKLFIDAEFAARDIISDLLDQFLQRLGNIGTNLVNVSLATVLGAISGKRALSDLFATLTGTVSGLLGNLSDAASTLTQQLVDAVSPHIQDLQTTLVNTSLDAAQSLLNTLANISQSIGRK